MLSIVVGLSAVATAAPASAHGGVQRSNDRVDLLEVDPPTTGIDVQVGGTGSITVRAAGAGEVVVLGYAGEPYLRVLGGVVSENQRSPSAELNRSLTGTGTGTAPADADAEPRWVVVAEDGEASWHDHRLHRMGQIGGRLDWEIELLVDGRPVVIRGALVAVRPPARWPWWALGLVLLGAGGAAWSRRAGARRRLLLGGLVAAGLGSAVVAAGAGAPLAWSGALAAGLALGWTARFDGAWVAGMAGLLVALVGGAELADLGYAELSVSVPDPLYRAAVVVCLAAGAGLALAAFEVTRLGGLDRASRG